MRIVLLSIMHKDIDMYENMYVEKMAAYMRKLGHEVVMQETPAKEIDYQIIKKYHPDILGFSVEYCLVDDVKKTVLCCKEDNEKLVIFAGGHYAALHHEMILREMPLMDIVFLNDNFESVQQVLKALEDKDDYKYIDNIAYHEGDKICVGNIVEKEYELDSMPFQARDFVRGKQIVTISTSEGCTANCSFCKNKYFYHGWKGRSPQNVAEEIELLEKDIHPSFYFFSDNSFDDPDEKGIRMSQICQECIDRKLEIYYATSFRATFYKKTNSKMNKLLIDSGLVAALVGIESGNEDDLRLYNKSSTLQDNREIVNYFRDLGVVLIPSFINFNPFSTVERLRKNIIFLREIGQCIRFFTFLDVLEYTPIYQLIKKVGLIIEKEKGEGCYSYNYFMMDDSVYEYRYQHNEIGQLAVCIKIFMQRLQADGEGVFDDILFYNERHMMQMNHIMRKAERYNQVDVKEACEEHFSTLNAIMSRFNDQLYCWINSLLELVEDKRGTYEILAKKTEDMCVFELFIEIRKSLSRERRIILHRIYKLNSDLVEAWM